MNKNKRDVVLAWAVMTILSLGMWLYIFKILKEL